MLINTKALYQVKLILDYLPEEEYKLIPQETIDYIEDNFEYDENIRIDPSIPLERQQIHDQAYELLEKIIKSVETNKEIRKSEEISQYIEKIKESNKTFEVEMENIKLKNIVELLKKENSKIPKAKELVEGYKRILKEKDKEIEKLKNENQNLYEIIGKIPQFITKKFLKEIDLKNNRK